MDCQKPMIDPNRTYSVSYASEFAGVSGETIRQKIKHKKLKAARVDNGPWRISGASLVEMMAPVTAIQSNLPTDRQWAADCRKILQSL
jgi:hypothetical protein